MTLFTAQSRSTAPNYTQGTLHSTSFTPATSHTTTSAVGIVDSYLNTSANSKWNLSNNAGLTRGGQTFTSKTPATLTSAVFSMSKTGSPTGNATAYLYALTGSGSTLQPTGSALATSDVLDVSTLTTSFVDTTFAFSGANQYSLAGGGEYAIYVEYTSGDASNQVNIAYDSQTVSHPGNGIEFILGAAWLSFKTLDTYFYVYGTMPYQPQLKN